MYSPRGGGLERRKGVEEGEKALGQRRLRMARTWVMIAHGVIRTLIYSYDAKMSIGFELGEWRQRPWGERSPPWSLFSGGGGFVDGGGEFLRR